MSTIPLDLMIAQNLAFRARGWVISDVKNERESQDYAACTLTFGGKAAFFRSAKITPKKVGFFVTLWKRTSKTGPIEPFDVTDEFEHVLISVRIGERLGLFIFPKMALVAKGIVRSAGKGGKLAFRVYAPWDIVTNTTAKKSQIWQNKYFYSLIESPDGPVPST